MPTGKMDMQLIDNEKIRMLTFERRKKCLFKKAYELSVLCDVEVCVVIGGCLSVNQRNDQWQTWPENLVEVGRIIRKFEVKRSSKTKGNVSNVVVQRQQNAVEKSVFPLWDSRIDCFSFERLLHLLEVLDQKSAAVDGRMTALQTTQVNELPIIDFSNKEEKTKNHYSTVNVLQTGQRSMDWIDYLKLDNPFLPDFPLNNEILQSENFHSLPEPVNHSIAVYLPVEPISEMGHTQPEHTCCLTEMDYYSIAAGEPSQWSSLPPLPHTFDSWPDFPLYDDGCIPNQIQYTPIKAEPEKGFGQPEHDGCMAQIGDYSTDGNPPTQPNELPPLPYESTSTMSFLPPGDISLPGFCGRDYHYPTNNREEDLFSRFNDIPNCQWD